MISIIPATPEIMSEWFDSMNSVTVKAIALVEDGEVIAVGGTYRSQCGNVLFMKASEQAKKRPKSLFKVAKEFASRYPVAYASCDIAIEGAERFLKHLGMKKVKGDVWQLHH